MPTESISNGELAFRVAALVADMVGERVFEGDDQIGVPGKNWRHPQDDTAVIVFTDGRQAVITVRVEEDASNG